MRHNSRSSSGELEDSLDGLEDDSLDIAEDIHERAGTPNYAERQWLPPAPRVQNLMVPL